MDEIAELKRQRIQFEASVRSVAEAHLKVLASFGEAGAEQDVEYLSSRNVKK